MCKVPHKHAELIKAWADGAEIQYNIGLGWKDYSSPQKTPSWGEPCIQFRIKPKTIRYRAALMITLTNIKYVATCNEPESSGIVEASNGFIKWLGDWQEVEV